MEKVEQIVNKVEQIIFDNQYPKLQNEWGGVLSAVITKIPSELLKTKWQHLLNFDTMRSDGRFYGIQDGIYYMLLLFITPNGRLVPTIRKDNEENEKYITLIGCSFEFVIIEDK